MRTTVHLPDDLLARAKKKAAADGRTLTSLIEEGLRQVLAPTATKSKAGANARLPTCSVANGVMPGIDLSKNSAAQDFLDEDVIRNAGIVKLR